jgi:hypothetical protein
MTAEPLVFPVGLLCGTYYDEDDAGGHHHEVRRGGRIHDLTDTELAAWLFAHGRPDAPTDETPWTAPELLRFLAEQQVAKPAPLVDSLLERGLLVEVARSGDGMAAFAGSHRVVPIMQGLGNSPDEPWMYSIGLMEQERIQVSRPVFDVWAWSHLDDTLWRACEVIAAQDGADGDADPSAVLAGFLSTLHGLLNAQAAYIDTVDTDPDGRRART